MVLMCSLPGGESYISWGSFFNSRGCSLVSEAYYIVRIGCAEGKSFRLGCVKVGETVGAVSRARLG